MLDPYLRIEGRGSVEGSTTKHQTESCHNGCLREYPPCQSVVVDVSECLFARVFTSVKRSCSWYYKSVVIWSNDYSYDTAMISYYHVDTDVSNQLCLSTTSSENFTCWRMDSTSKDLKPLPSFKDPIRGRKTV